MNSITGFPITRNVTVNPITLRGQTFPGLSEGRYMVRLAQDWLEIESALRLRHQVFNVELGNHEAPEQSGLEFDAYDFNCLHLIVIEKDSGITVGTYRLNSIETAHSIHGFYAASEFTIEDLPEQVLNNGLELGRACVAREHRNTKVLFLLWKTLIAFLEHSKKQYFFGCCSIFTQDVGVGRTVFRQLVEDGYLDPEMSIMPCRNGLSFTGKDADGSRRELPALFNMYLRIGARVCGPPMIDREFGTIDFFVVFDITQMNPKYRRLFS